MVQRGWDSRTMGISQIELNRMNQASSPEEAMKELAANRESLARGVAAEFQARHCSFTPHGARAYTDSWL